MNFPNPISFTDWIPRLAKTATTVSACAAMTGCASIGNPFHPAESPLPIKILNATGGEIPSAHAIETSDRLYVSGSIRRGIGHQPPLSAHVDVQLLDKNSRILAEKQDEIDLIDHPRTARGRSHRSSYVASFPLDLVRQAASIRVIYHPKPHAIARLNRRIFARTVS